MVIIQQFLRKILPENTSDSNNILRHNNYSRSSPILLSRNQWVELQKEQDLLFFSLNSNTITKIEADLTAGTTTTGWNKWHLVYVGGVSLFPVHCSDTTPYHGFLQARGNPNAASLQILQKWLNTNKKAFLIVTEVSWQKSNAYKYLSF